VVARNGAHLSASQLKAIGKICDALPNNPQKVPLHDEPTTPIH
jgi:hypothetical protein